MFESLRTTNPFYPIPGNQEVDGEVVLDHCEETRLFYVMVRLMVALRDCIPLIPFLKWINANLGKKAKKGWSHYGAQHQGLNWRGGEDAGNVLMGFAVHLLAGATARHYPHTILRLNFEHAADLMEILLGLIWWVRNRYHVRGGEFRQSVLREMGQGMRFTPMHAIEMERLWQPGGDLDNIVTWEPCILEVIAAMEALLTNVPEHFPWLNSAYDWVRWRAAFVGIQAGDPRYVRG